jgi:hypothetical protein
MTWYILTDSGKGSEEDAGKLCVMTNRPGGITTFSTLEEVRARREEIIKARADRKAPFGPTPRAVSAARLQIWANVASE